MRKPTIYNSNGANSADIPSNYGDIENILPTTVTSRICTPRQIVRYPSHKGAQRPSPFTKVNGNVARRLKWRP
mgnify:CR=1 FL=1